MFWINLPLCALALWWIHDTLGALNRRGERAPSDLLGAAWLVLALAALMIPVTRIGQGVPWHDPVNGAVLLASLPLLAGFVWHEGRVAAPILPLRLLRIPTVASSSALGFIVYSVMITLTVMVPLRAQWVQQLSIDDSAWRLMSMSMGIPFAATVAGRYMHRQARVRPLLLSGALLCSAALAVLPVLPTGTPAFVELPCLFLLGMGMGLQLPTALVASQHAVGPALIGTVTALSGLSRQLGGAIGVAVLSALLLRLMQQALPSGHAGGLEALVMQLGARNGAAVDRGALDGSFRAVLWGCLLVSLLAWPFAWRMPETRLDKPHG